MVNTRNTAARQARIQEEHDAGSMAERFPEVEKIVVTLTYSQRGIKGIVRNRWFLPSSFAFFRLTCLSRDCVDGGFDMSRTISDMIRSRSLVRTGELHCEGGQRGPCAAHAAYEIAIAYI